MEEKKKGKPTFSVIVPMKNAEQYIHQVLQSIEKQGDKDYELLIIDDQSNEKDVSKEVVKKWGEQHPLVPLRLYETKKGRGGPGGARNIGLDHAKGEYIIFLDVDDVLRDDAFFHIHETIKENPNVDVFVLGYQLTRLDFKGNQTMVIPCKAGKMQESRLYQIGVNTAGSMWNVCAKKTLYDKKGHLGEIRFQENCIFEDVPTKMQLFIRNKKKIKAVKYMTHTQFSRPCKTITGNLTFKDIPRLIQANLEVANLKEETDCIKDRAYINVRIASMPAVLSWCVTKCIHNKMDRIRMRKEEREEK